MNLYNVFFILLTACVLPYCEAMKNDQAQSLHYMAIEDSENLREYLLKKKLTYKEINSQEHPYEYTPLHCAILSANKHRDRIDNVRYLIKAGASLTIQGTDGKTPVDLADNNIRNQITFFLSEKKEIFEDNNENNSFKKSEKKEPSYVKDIIGILIHVGANVLF